MSSGSDEQALSPGGAPFRIPDECPAFIGLTCLDFGARRAVARTS